MPVIQRRRYQTPAPQSPSTAQLVPPNRELREDNGAELREDGTIELRE